MHFFLEIWEGQSGETFFLIFTFMQSSTNGAVEVRISVLKF